MELHLPRLAIRSLKITCQGFSHTVSELGLRLTLEYSIVVETILGSENLEPRLGKGACDGSGHHFERKGTTI